MNSCTMGSPRNVLPGLPLRFQWTLGISGSFEGRPDVTRMPGNSEGRAGVVPADHLWASVTRMYVWRLRSEKDLCWQSFVGHVGF